MFLPLQIRCYLFQAFRSKSSANYSFIDAVRKAMNIPFLTLYVHHIKYTAVVSEFMHSDLSHPNSLLIFQKYRCTWMFIGDLCL